MTRVASGPAAVDASAESAAIYEALGRLAASANRIAVRMEQHFTEFPDTAIDQPRVSSFVPNDDVLRKRLATNSVLGPGARDEMCRLARAIGDCVELMARASDLLEVHNVEAAMDQSIQQCRLLSNATGRLADALAGAPAFGQLSAHVGVIQRKRAEGRRVLRDAVSALFDDGIHPRVIMQWKEIFSLLDAALAACERAAESLVRLAATT